VKVHFIPVSQNAKTGPIPVSIIERASCWPGCALYENGCYAESGALAMHWDRVSRGSTGGSWPEFCTKVAALRPGRLWRYAQAGDLPGYGAQIDGGLLEELVAANIGKNAIAFTHKPVLGDDPVAVENRRLIAAAIEAGFTVNLSADSPAHADRLADLGIAPVVTVLARAYARRAVRHRFKRQRDEWAETIGGLWCRADNGEVYPSLNQLSESLGTSENAWDMWLYVNEAGERKPISTLRDPQRIRRRARAPQHANVNARRIK
jgi:hypothetical protein